MSDPLTRLRAFQRELERGRLLTMAFDHAYPSAWGQYGEARKQFASDLGALLDEREGEPSEDENALMQREDDPKPSHYRHAPRMMPSGNVVPGGPTNPRWRGK